MALTGTSLPFQNVSMPALDLRRFLGVLITSEGVATSADLAVSQRAAGANMSVDVAAGEGYVQGDTVAYQGFYWVLNDAVTNVTVTAAHATLPRVDRVCVRVRDTAHGGAANDLAFVVVAGTATSGATLANTTGAAALPADHLLLANILIPAAATTVTTANIDTTGASNNSPAVRPRLLASGSPDPAVVLISDTILAADGTFDIQSISGSYRHLEIVASLRTADTNGLAILRFNNDSGANYIGRYATDTGGGNLGTAVASGTSGISLGPVSASSDAATKVAVHRIMIGDYARTTWNKVVEYHGFADDTAGGLNGQTIGGGSWRNTAAINRVQMLGGAGGNLEQGSRLTIYARA